MGDRLDGAPTLRPVFYLRGRGGRGAVELYAGNRQHSFSSMKGRNYYLRPVTGIYLISDRATGKQYVGQSKDVGSRWCHHLAGSSTSALAAELRKRPQDFTFQVVQTCNLEDLDLLEGRWIEEVGTMEPAGYNRQSAPRSSRKGSGKGEETPEAGGPSITTSHGQLTSEGTGEGRKKGGRKTTKSNTKG